MPKELIVEKSVVINKSKNEVFDYLKICKNQDQFSVWNMQDPAKKTSYEGTDGTVGFVYKWDSANKQVGAGSQKITKIEPGVSIVYDLHFERPMKNTAVAKFAIATENTNQTKVSWEFRGATKFPMSLFKGIFQKMLGKDMEKSLNNLKQVLEK